MSAPEPGCPAWCERHTPAGFVETIPVEEVHQAPRWRGSISVALMQVGGGRVYLSFDGSTDISLRDAPHLADTMRRLGHPEIEAAIRELLVLADEELTVTSHPQCKRPSYTVSYQKQRFP